MKMAPSIAQGLCLLLLVGASHAIKFGVSSGLRGSKMNLGSDNALHTISSAKQTLTVKRTLMVKQLISGQLDVSKAISGGFKTMDPKEAMERLKGKLPPGVESLMKMAATESKSRLTGEYTEVSLQKARGILNDMIEKSWVELDDKVIECKEFEERNRGTYTQVVADMARLSSQIAALEKEEARANNAIEAADSARSNTEDQMELLKQEYKAQKLLDDAEMTKRQADLAVFDFILNMTACQGSVFLLQTPTKPGVQVCAVDGGLELNFDSPEAQKKLGMLMTPNARQIITDALGTFQESKMALMSQKQAPTFFSNQTVQEPPTAMPVTLPVVAEPAADGQWKKCTQEPNCGLLHDTMSLEWGKFKDEVDCLQTEMTKKSDEFKEGMKTLNDMLTMLSAKKAAEMVALDDATAKKGNDQGELKDKTEQKHELQHEFTAKMKECDYKISEILFTNICAVRSVRNEVMEFSTVSPQDKIEDCDVKDWIVEDCTVACDDKCPQSDPYACGGWQMLDRAIIVSNNQYGIKCPPLRRKKKCNQFKCPVDCEMSMWTAWGRCSKDCEGGVQSKTRAVMIRPKNGGEMCDTVQESRSCNTGSCDRDCSLHPWTEWTPCSMACSGGLQERVRNVEIPIRGEGKCPTTKNPERFEKQECNTQDCKGDELCIAVQDMVLLVDASGSLREEGFATVRSFASNLTDRYMSNYKGDYDRIQMSAVLFGNGHLGPGGVISPAIRLSGLTNDTLAVRNEILATKWQRGFTNLAQAFVLADVILQQRGRPQAQSAVMIIWDGKYSFAFETCQKAKMLKDKNVQIYMAVIAGRLSEDQTKYAHKWVSHPWETNFEHIPGLESLESAMDQYIQKVIVKFCPHSFSPMQMKIIDDLAGYSKIKQFAQPGTGCSSMNSIGKFATRDECAQAAAAAGSQIFIFDRLWRKQANNDCWVAPEFQTFDLAQYSEWTTLFWEGGTVGTTYMKSHTPHYVPVPCPGGPADDGKKFMGGWEYNKRFNAYALKPPA